MRPDFTQCAQQLVDIAVAMHRRWGNTQTLGTARHGRVIDRLYVDTVIVHQPVTNEFALVRVAHHYRDDMARVWNVRNGHPVKRTAYLCDTILVQVTFGLAVFEVTDARACVAAFHNLDAVCNILGRAHFDR